jgi:hypothetical protein
MTIESLTQVHTARPFQPFRIHLADGRTLEVAHPELLAHPRGGRTIVVFTSPDVFEIIDLLLVTSLELINGKSKPARRK